MKRIENMENEIKGNMIATITISNGTQYAFFDDGSIYEITEQCRYKRVNDLLDKDKRLKNKILKYFDDSHNSDVIKNGEKIIPGKDLNGKWDEIELPEL